MKFIKSKGSKAFLKTFFLHGRKYFLKTPCYPCFFDEFEHKSVKIYPPLIKNMEFQNDKT